MFWLSIAGVTNHPDAYWIKAIAFTFSLLIFPINLVICDFNSLACFKGYLKSPRDGGALESQKLLALVDTVQLKWVLNSMAASQVA